MKKRLFILILTLLAITGSFSDLTKFSERNFRKLMEQKWARTVFDMDEEEAVSVFGCEGEAIFL